MKLKTSELKGRALDWAVAMALGYQPAKWEKRLWGRELVLAPERTYSAMLIGVAGNSLTFKNFEPTVDWSQGGPIIEREQITLDGNVIPCQWVAILYVTDEEPWEMRGPTPLIAAMRCYVASKTGDEVEVPDELC